jgi:hypothetical protein
MRNVSEDRHRLASKWPQALRRSTQEDTEDGSKEPSVIFWNALSSVRTVNAYPSQEEQK